MIAPGSSAWSSTPWNARITSIASIGYISMQIVEEACVRIPLTRDVVGDDGLIADMAVRERLAAALEALRAGAARVESL